MSDCIELEGLAMHFRGCEALREVNLAIPRGSVFELLGENGAGKTTLIRILTGFQRPTSGSVRVLGLDPLAVLPVVEGNVEVLSEQKSGRQVRWIALNGDASIEKTVSDWPGVHSVRSRPASLEELFVACTRGSQAPSQLSDDDSPRVAYQEVT